MERVLKIWAVVGENYACSVLRTFLLVVLINLLDVRGSLASTGVKNGILDSRYKFVKNREEFASEETKRQMLNVLGMDELPKPRHGIVPHQYMIQIYEKMSRRKPEQSSINTIRGFVDVGNDDSSGKTKFHQIYSFNISALPSSEKIISADLRVLRLATGLEWKYAWGHGTEYRAKLYYKRTVNHVWNLQVYTHTQSILLDSVIFDIRNKQSENWKVFKVVDAMRLWQNDSYFVHDLEVRIESARTGYLMPATAFGFTENGRPHYKRALLVSFTDDGREREAENEEEKDTKRKRNSKKKKTIAKSDKEEESSNRLKRSTKRRRRKKPLCNRKKLYVDFALLGWSEWIIAPRGYNAYYCQGICKYPIPEHLKPTNHAIVQTTVHANKRRVPPACCVPDKLTGLSILYLDKGNSVVYKKYDKMIAESCGCK